MHTDGDGERPDGLVAPEGVNSGGPVINPEGPRVADPGQTGEETADRTSPSPAGGDNPPAGDNGQLLSGAARPPGGRPPQPGQEMEAGEG